MKIGYNQATLMGSSSLEQDLLLCEQEGFDFIEIRLDMLETYLLTHSLHDLSAFFQNSRLKPHAMNALYLYSGMFAADTDKARQKHYLDPFLLGCRTAEAIGSHDFVVVPPLGPHFEGGTREEVFHDCVRSLLHLSDIGRSYGIRIGFEPVGGPSCSVRTIEFAKEIVEAVDREDVGYVVDPANIYSYKKCNEFSAITSVEPAKIFVAHINDYDDVPESELTREKRCFCGEGVIDLANYLECLKKSDYDGMISIETFRPSYWEIPPEQAMRKAMETTRATLERNGCLDE